MLTFRIAPPRTMGAHGRIKCIITLFMLCNAFTVSSQEMLWGLGSLGGESGIGAIFKSNADGSNLEVKKSFQAIAGRSPLNTKLVQFSNGKIYGLTHEGGAYLKGVLFEYNPTDNSYIKKHDFDGSTGSSPYGSLVRANDKLYGMTSSGGMHNKGVIFEYDPVSDTFSKKFDFDGLSGSEPCGDLVLMPNGDFYGVTYTGGANNYGVIFKYEPEKNTYTKKIDLDGSAGIRPFGGMTLTSSGNLFGMAYQGGSHFKGTIYQYDTVANSMTKKIDFSGTANGAYPIGSLIQANNGLLYGMTLAGGSIDQGTLFEFNSTTGVLTKKLDFDGGTKGLAPYGSLFQASNGKLYGTTEQGIAGFGGLFEYEISSGNLLTVVSFDGNAVGKGGGSRTTVFQASDGKLYGMTRLGGLVSQGVLFSYDPVNGGYQVKISFNASEVGDGNWPLGSLVQGANGKLYGTTYLGGNEREGILFEYDVTYGIYTKKFDFKYNLGSHPASGILRASNGKLYGVTRFGGTENAGVVFEYNPATNVYVKKADFPSDMGSPTGSLIQITNGKMYGVTDRGGLNNQGILFEYDPVANVLVRKGDFNTALNGSTPSGSLLYSNNKIYGLAKLGGANGKGTLFEYNPVTEILSKVNDFDGSFHGSEPVGSLIQAKSGKLYCVARTGGNFNWGAIVEFDPSNGNFVKKFDFTGDEAEGLDIHGALVESSNGKLYGTTLQGGLHGKGVLFEYDISTNTYTKKQDFTGMNGDDAYGPLLFISMQEQTIDFTVLEEKIFGDDPFEIYATTTSSTPEITYSSSNPDVATVNENIVTIHGAGTTTITASQAGSINFHSASATQVLTVNKSDQVITFNSIPEKTSVDDPFPLSASTTSGLPITFTSDNSTVGSISGNTLTINSDGSATVTASQPGNDNYNSAAVSQILIVNFVLAAESPIDSKMKIYPNPASMEIFIERGNAPTFNTSHLVISDVLGRSSRILLESLGNGIYKCSTNELRSGLHFLMIPGDNRRQAVIIVR